MSAPKNKYIDLKINGKLFPLWILSNFRKYKLTSNDNKDDDKTKKQVLKLRKYQKFIGKYLDYRSPYRDILIYHGLGAGKTAAAINVYNVLYNYTPGWNIFVLIKAGLRDTWKDDIDKWLTHDDEYQERFNNIYFIHYDSPVAEKTFLEKIQSSDVSNRNMFIIDEVHLFISNVYNNMSSQTGKRALTIYNYIVNFKLERPDTRIMTISGTPAVNSPFELALLFNLMRPNIFPSSEAKFNQEYLFTNGIYSSVNPDAMNMFQRRILGLTSYYKGDDEKLFAKKKIHHVDNVMSDLHQDIYNSNEYMERKLSQQRRQANAGSGDYMMSTRQACNFVFPYINEKINGTTRPNASKIKQQMLQDEPMASVRNAAETSKEANKELATRVKEAYTKFMTALVNHWKKLHATDSEANHTIQDDVKHYLQKYKTNFKSFIADKKVKKSSLLLQMFDCSPKMTNIVFNILHSPGPTVVFSSFVQMEGIAVFKIYLKFVGFTNNAANIANKTTLANKKSLQYVEYHGSIDRPVRIANRRRFNAKENIYGEYIKVFMLTKAGSEGINLFNVRQIHIVEPYWNEVLVEQVIGRGIRQKSHNALPMKDRHVDVFRYTMSRKSQKPTADEKVYKVASAKANVTKSFLLSVKQTAVDCKLFHSENTKNDKFDCFQFDEESYFQNITPAYKQDIHYDRKMNNGLNSQNSKLIKLRVMKITGVMEISTGKYSDPAQYLYSKERGTVYDEEFHFPVGKVRIVNGIPERVDKTTYLIRNVVPIPRLVDR